jgi:hypothetical protein
MFLYEVESIGRNVLDKLSDKDIDNHFWEITEQLWCQIFIEGSLK